MFHIALFEPRIAPNTGNIIRLAANNGCDLHLIEPLGFDLQDKQLRRAGLDYHDLAHVTRHTGFEAFRKSMASRRMLICTTRGITRYDQLPYQAGDVLLFGSETSGLPQHIHDQVPEEHKIVLPMKASSRSLNLSNAVAIISYEACRQLDFRGL